MKKNVSPLQKSPNVWAIILILWSIYRAEFRDKSPPCDEFLVKPLLYTPCFLVYKRIEKEAIFSQVDLHKKTIISDLLWGGGLGVAFFTVGYMGIILKQGTASVQILKLFQPQTFIIFAIAFATSVKSEEILSEGFCPETTLRGIQKCYKVDSYFQSFIFFLHIPILFTSQHMTGARDSSGYDDRYCIERCCFRPLSAKKKFAPSYYYSCIYTFSLTFFLS